MKIFVSKIIGFCSGVSKTINDTFSFSKKFKKTYVLGELIHNDKIISKLKNENINTLDCNYFELKTEIIKILKDEKDFGLIFTAHGHENNLEDFIKKSNIEYLDSTCPFIKKIHKNILENIKNEYICVYIGNKKHIESIINIDLIKTKMNIIPATDPRKINFNSINKKILFVNQSTYRIDYLNEFMLKNYPYLNYRIVDNFCPSVRQKYKEIKDVFINNIADFIIIITDKKSSNGNQLFKYSQFCLGKDKVFSISSKEEIKMIVTQLDKDSRVFVSSATSMDKETINEIVKELKNY